MTPQSTPAKANDGVRSAGWIRRLATYLKPHRTNVAITFSAAVLGSLCTIAAPLIARQIVDNVIVARHANLWPWLIGLVVIALAGFGFSYLRRYRGSRVGLEVQNDLRNDMHDHLQRLDMAALDRMSVGQLVARANSDTALVQGLIGWLPIVSGNVLNLVLSLVVMFFLSPVLALVSVAIVPALILVSYRMRTKVFPASWDAQQREGVVAEIVDEVVGGVRVVKAFGQEGRELHRLTDAAVDLYGSQMRSTRIQAKYQPMLEAIPALGQVGILALGGWLAVNGQLTLGTFLAFSTYVAGLMAPARQLTGILTIAQQARAGVDRIFQLLDLTPSIVDAPHATEFPTNDARIDFSDVTFSYDGSAPILRGLNLSIKPGERVALVGSSGSGKSTLVRLLLRYYDPDEGSVRIGGNDVRDLRLAALRGTLGIAFEDAFLFSASIRDNIAYGSPEATTEQIEAAAQAAEADSFIRHLPQGYDTVVGERGLSLSGGQRQRIALARVLLRNPGVLILDDATSAIDARTEHSIHGALNQVMSDRTVILVAHRHSTLHLADRIVVLDKGQIVDEGTHETLLKRSSVYRALFGPTDAERRGEVDALANEATDTPTSFRAPDRRSASGVPLARSLNASNLGMGLGGGGGGGGRRMRANLAPTPELLARVAALPPVRDIPMVDPDSEGRHRRHFSLGTLVREFRKPLLAALVFVIIDAITGLLGPAIVKTGIDEGVVEGASGVLFGAVIFYLVIVILDMFNDMAESFVTGRVAQRVMLSLRIRIFAQLQRLSLDYYEREMAGRIMTRMTTDVDQFESLLQNGLLGAVVAFVTFIGVGVALVIVNMPLGLAVLCVVIPLAIATWLYRRRAVKLYDQSRERIAVVNAAFQEDLSGVRESQAFTHEDVTINTFHALGRRYLDSRIAAQRLVAVYFPFVQFLSAIADVIVLGFGALLISEGHLTTGALIAFLLYIDMFFSPIQQLSQVFDAWQQTRVSVSRISDLMLLETLTPQAEDPIPVPELAGDVKVDHVRFAYPTGSVSRDVRGPADRRDVRRESQAQMPREALEGVALQIYPGETVALVGETGAGKSTVMKLLARFYDPNEGAVLADGMDLRALDLPGYRASLGYVPQESFLFTGTVADNIAYGRPSASREDVVNAARAVGADRMIESLPDGYDTVIAERGKSLSAGQRQLLALARADLVRPAILLLDEATSNLDLATESRVTRAMNNLARGRTTVLIAHRLQTARTADRIVVLKNGAVVESGTHDDLLAAHGLYAGMWQTFERAGNVPA